MWQNIRNVRNFWFLLACFECHFRFNCVKFSALAIAKALETFVTRLMRLCHPPDGSTSPKYKLLCFITTKKICKEKNTLAFNRDRCCHLVLCLQLIPFHLLQL
jgi:hypothetical protein